MMSDPISSSDNVRRIKRIYNYSDEVAIEFTAPHPFETGEALTSRGLGWDGATTQMHRAFGWGTMPGDVKRNAYSTVPDENGLYFGGAAQTITRLDSRRILLPGVPWKLRSSDPDPVFFGVGHTYRKDKLVDTRPFHAEAMAFIGDEPCSLLDYGAGFFVLKHPGNTIEKRGWVMPAQFTRRGAGRNLTTVFRDDYYNQIPFTVQNWGCRTEGLADNGNRAFQMFAGHGIKVTAPDGLGGDDNVHFYTSSNVGYEDLPGYGINMGHPGGKRWVDFFDTFINGTTNDGMDVKGPHDSNGDGLNYFGVVSKYKAKNWGFLYLGTMRTAPRELARNNPITTTLDSSLVYVWPGQQTYQGQRITFADNTPAVGGVELAGRSFQVTTQVQMSGAWRSTINVAPQVATSTETGGGSAVEITMPSCNKGKPALDGRGHGLRYIDVTLGGYWLQNRPFRLRGGSAGPGNGSGAHESQIIGLHCTNETPAALGYFSNPVEISARDVTMSTFTYVGNGSGAAMAVYGSATGFTGNGIRINSAGGVGGFGAADVDVSMKVKDCLNGVTINGSAVGAIGGLGENPFRLSAGSTIVRVTWPNTDTSRPGLLGEFYLDGVDIDYGVNLNGGPWICTAVNSAWIEFESDQEPELESGTVQFGGDDVVYQRGSNVSGSGVFNLEMFAMKAGGFGVSIGENASQTDLRINGKYVGDGTPATGFTGRVDWGANNVGFPNTRPPIYIETPSTRNLLATDFGPIGRLCEVKGTIGGQATFNLPPAAQVQAAKRIRFYTRSSYTNSLVIQAQGTDKIHVGALTSAAAGTAYANSVGASGELVASSENGQWAWYLFAIGTWDVT